MSASSDDDIEKKIMPRRTSYDANHKRSDYVEMPEEERKNLGRILRQARRAKSYTQAQVAVAASATPQAIGYWEAGKNTTSPARLAAIGQFLNVDIEAARKGEFKPAEALPNGEQLVPPVVIPAAPTPLLDAEWMNLLGTTDFEDGSFFITGAIARIRRPPGLKHAYDVAAINVASENMRPRFKLGELIYIQRRIAGHGDDAVLEFLADGDDTVSRCLLLEVVEKGRDEFVCRQHNPSQEVRLPRPKVKNVWRVLNLVDLLGY